MDYGALAPVWRALIAGGLFFGRLGLCLWMYWAADPGVRGTRAWRLAGAVAVLLTLPSLALAPLALDGAAQRWANPLFYLALAGAVATVTLTLAFVLMDRPGVGETPARASSPEPRRGTAADDAGGSAASGTPRVSGPNHAPAVAASADQLRVWANPAARGASAPAADGARADLPPVGANPPARGGPAMAAERARAAPGQVIGDVSGAEREVVVAIAPPLGPVTLAWLVERRGPRPGHPHPLHTVTLLGRGPDCTIVVDDPTVSERHARLELRPDGSWLLTDLGSPGGTFLVWAGVDGEQLERLSSAALREPDVVRLGTREFIFMAVPSRTGARIS